MKIYVVMAFILILSSTTHDMIYLWTDTNGVTHYTNRDYEIPDRYRRTVRLLYSREVVDHLSGTSRPERQKDPDADQSPPHSSTGAAVNEPM
jgi:hypothetical protein